MSLEYILLHLTLTLNIQHAVIEILLGAISTTKHIFELLYARGVSEFSKFKMKGSKENATVEMPQHTHGVIANLSEKKISCKTRVLTFKPVQFVCFDCFSHSYKTRHSVCV